MNLREYIDKLNAIGAEHGFDLEVETLGPYFERCAALEPRVAHRMVLKGRETKQRFYSRGDDADRQGAKVVKV